MRRARFPMRWTAMTIVATSAVALMSCGDSSYGDPGPSWRGFEFTRRNSSLATQVVVVVVDDRRTVDASELRAGLSAAVRAWGENLLADSYVAAPDVARWHPVDLRFVLVPASSNSVEEVASPATNAALAWTSHQATEMGRDALALAIDAEVQRMPASSDATFRPLDRARDIADLLNAKRPPSGDAEMALVASSTSQGSRMVGVAIVASTDDQSPNDATSYRLDDASLGTPVNVITPGSGGKNAPDADRFPRLNAWASRPNGSWFNGCYASNPAPPYVLFQSGCVDYGLHCDARAIHEISPGLGDCYVEITTSGAAGCDASRGWADPTGTDHVRRAQQNEHGESICELLPVQPPFMDACMHDETCADCDSGWCVSEVQPGNKYCPNAPPKWLRWIGGALPDPGSIHVICRQPD